MEHNKIVKVDNNISTYTPPDINYLKELANEVVTSPLADPFKNKDGKVDVGAIFANMALGYEMGLTPIASLTLGKQLNKNSYFSVLRGKELGIDPVTSMNKIYNIPTKNGNILSLSVDIISKTILENCDIVEYPIDSQPVNIYKSLDGVYLGHYYNIHNEDKTLKDNIFVYIPNVTPKDELAEAVKSGNIIAQKIGITIVTAIRIVRKSAGIDKIFYYSLQEATDAGLYRGYHSTLIDSNTKKPLYIEGRDNWNKHPLTLLRNRVTSIAGRIVVADRLQGAYSHEEAMEIVNVNDEDELQNIKIE